MHFIVYNRQTGEILRTGICPPEAVQYQARPDAGEAAMEGVADAGQHFIQDGKIVLLPEPVREKLRNRPTHPAKWDFAAGEWKDIRSKVHLDRETRQQILNQIAGLERKQLRSLRELTIGRGNSVESRRRLEDIDDQIAALRAQLPEV